MKAKVIETGEIVNVTPYPTWYKEDGQGPDRREWDEDELEFIYSNKKAEESLQVKENDLVEELDYDDYITFFKEHPDYNDGSWGFEETWTFAQYCYKLGLKAQKGE